jgi:iron(III)-enterobactin esterase
MLIEDLSHIKVEQRAIPSAFLNRHVIVDLYLPKRAVFTSQMNLLLINDGQDLEEMKLSKLLDRLCETNSIPPLFCVGIHAGKDRRNEYGTAGILDYQGRGAKARAYDAFVLEELFPFIHSRYGVESFLTRSYCGFSLGGLKAIDAVWNYPEIFSCAGVFSGSLWWRTRALHDNYNDDTDRIMHQQVRNGQFRPGLKFYFTTGSLDETDDRNGNGVIDSIDDTVSLIEELKRKGYDETSDIHYVNYEDGKHNIDTWARAMPGFLLWGWPFNALHKIKNPF